MPRNVTFASFIISISFENNRLDILFFHKFLNVSECEYHLLKTNIESFQVIGQRAYAALEKELIYHIWKNTLNLIVK